MSKRKRKERKQRERLVRGGWVAPLPLQSAQFAGLTTAVGPQAPGEVGNFGDGAGEGGGDGGSV